VQPALIFVPDFTRVQLERAAKASRRAHV